ncbi:Lon protease family protein [Rhodosalinus sp. 5P4]|uniref:Lon protease family protein n=1 Tax=Rhodosalinus sp. 5P4 TaxID=3239196 RepID=UPI003523B260
MAATASGPEGLPAERLQTRCDPSAFPFASTAELDGPADLIGQERALDAIRLAGAIPHRDFNVFALGPEGTGRHSALMRILGDAAADRPRPKDWVYVNNFEAEHKPRAIGLPPGTALPFRDAMQDLVDDLASDLPALFESDDYQSQRRAIEQEFSEEEESSLEEFAERARAEDIALLRTPMGFMLSALRDGELVKPDDYRELDEEERAEIDAKIARLQEELAVVLREAPRRAKRHRERVEALNAAMAKRVVDARVAEVAEAFDTIPDIQDFVAELREDIVANAELFLRRAAQSKDAPFPDTVGKAHMDPLFGRYAVNVMVGQEAETETGAPLEHEALPTLDRVVGRIEHATHMGSLVTNFTMIKPGALHRANGGFLVLDARRILSEPYAWDGLKRCLRNGEITISSLGERMSLVSTTSLEPDPIPLDLRVALVGDRMLHALLVMLDPDFARLFKLQADFDDVADRDDETLMGFARLFGSQARAAGLRALTAAGVARLADEAARLAGDTEKLSLRLEALGNLMQEADHYAGARGGEEIGAGDIAAAVTARERRASRLRDRMQEAIRRGTVLIDTAGAEVGQINGLSVIGLGDYAFGRPSRITARVRLGAGKLVDIEREVELGGPLHSKGVMILSGYLTGTYARDLPFSLHASLVFEQSYGGVDGDSASSAELYALLSALADLPIDQGLAVTGSINQKGEVQPIGGVNEKIEGFFETCAARGLTGRQGVLIPEANVAHLMLRDEVVEAVRAGEFRVIPVSRVDEGVGILTGTPAGTRGEDGEFPPESVNGRVDAALRRFAEARRAFVRAPSHPGAGGPDGEGAP